MKDQRLVNNILKYSSNKILQHFEFYAISSMTMVLTNLCNLNCRMCDIWERGKLKTEELQVEDIKQLFENSCLSHVRYITLTGGEPFLRTDLKDVLALIWEFYPKCQVHISTNGTLTSSILNFLSSVHHYKRLALEFSIHGIKIQDSISQSPGAWQNLNKTVQHVQQQFPMVKLFAKYVITPWNIRELEDIGAFCCEKKIPLSIKLIENSREYTNVLHYEKNRKERLFNFSLNQKKQILYVLEKFKNKKFIEKQHIKQLKRFLFEKNISRECFVHKRTLFINSSGIIYRCRNFPAIGNIKNNQCSLRVNQHFFKNYGKSDGPEVCKTCFSFMRDIV